MSDDLGAWFDDLDRVAVPAGDLGWVVREGRARRRRRVVARIVSVSVLAVALGGAAWIVGGQGDRPVPADVTDPSRLTSGLVPVVMEGPSPPPELAAGWQREQARVVTVAFHALLDRVPRRLYDYEGVRRAGDGWVVEFRDGTEAAALYRSLERRVEDLAAEVEELTAHRRGLADAADRLVARLEEASGKRARELRRDHDRLRETEARLLSEMSEVESQLTAVEERRDELRGKVRTPPVSLVVTERDGVVVVENSSVRGVAGYAEAVHRIDTWGADYYGLRIRRVRPDHPTVAVEVRSFWTGPLLAPYEESCRAVVMTRDGTTLAAMPDRASRYDQGPSDEDRRDGEQISFGFDYEGDVDGLSLHMQCRWRPRQ